MLLRTFVYNISLIQGNKNQRKVHSNLLHIPESHYKNRYIWNNTSTARNSSWHGAEFMEHKNNFSFQYCYRSYNQYAITWSINSNTDPLICILLCFLH
jgi:hypothetical protein